MRVLLLGLCCFLLSACQTIQPQETQIDSNTIRVSYSGINRNNVENTVLYQAAQTTLNHGFNYFIIVNNNVDVNNQYYQTPGTYMFNNNVGTYMPGQIYGSQSYNSSVIIKMFKGKKPKDSLNAYDAMDVIQTMQPSMQR